MTTGRDSLRRWGILLLGLYPLFAVWSLSNPLFASPDETVHMVRAQGVANLDFTSPYATDGIPIGDVECYRFDSDATADCMALKWSGPTDGVDAREVNGYPPVLHVIAAVPHLVTQGISGAYAMRLFVALANAALLAWALVLAARHGSWSVVGVVVATTPMVVFTSSTVNPSGLAATGAALFVTGALASGESTRRWAERFAPLLVGAIVVIGSRRDGALWLAAVAALLAARSWSGRRSLMMLVQRATWRARLLVAAAVTSGAVLVGLLSVPRIWTFVHRQHPGSGSAWNATRQVTLYLRQLIGTFGWLDATMGDEAFLLSIVVTSGLILAAVQVADSRQRLVLLAALVMLLCAPIAFGAVRHPYFQGRYLFPMWVALSVMAGSALDSARSAGRATGLHPGPWMAIWSVVHLWAFAYNLKRYATGGRGSWNLISAASWQPPLFGNGTAIVLFASSLIAAATSIVVATRSLPARV